MKDIFSKQAKNIDIVKNILRLPKISINFSKPTADSLPNYSQTFRHYTKPHRLKFFKNKTIGVALVDLNAHKSFENYYKSVNGKNSAAYYSRKANKRGYRFLEISRNDYIDDIHAINISAPARQGRKMAAKYNTKTREFTDQPNYKYFGVVTEDGTLVSYCNVGFYGEFSSINTLLGHKDHLNNGVMYLMIIELHKTLFERFRPEGYNFVMYDTFFGASDGLKMFKNKLGYAPYRVKWIWDKLNHSS